MSFLSRAFSWWDKTVYSQNSDKVWKRFGREDPYFGVFSREEYRGRNLREDSLADFFRSGQEHVDLVLRTVRAHLDPDFTPYRALDFGCGVGRIAIPLASLCKQVVGLDVSADMLQEAQTNCELRDVNNVELVESDDSLSGVSGTFDLIHSFVVFQHIPMRRGEDLTRRLIEKLDDGGIGVLHFTYLRKASRLRKTINYTRKTVPLVNNLVNLAQGRAFTYPMMQMNSYRLNRIFTILYENECRDVHAQITDHGGYLGAMLFFKKGNIEPWPMEDAFQEL